MSKECIFCGKKPQVGNLVSHSNIKTKRRFNPNLQRVRHQFPDGSVRISSYLEIIKSQDKKLLRKRIEESENNKWYLKNYYYKNVDKC